MYIYILYVLPVCTNSETTCTGLRKEWPTVPIDTMVLVLLPECVLCGPVSAEACTTKFRSADTVQIVLVLARIWLLFWIFAHGNLFVARFIHASYLYELSFEPGGLWAVISLQPRWSMELLALHVKVESNGNGRFGCSLTQTKQRLKDLKAVLIEGEHLMRKYCISWT